MKISYSAWNSEVVNWNFDEFWIPNGNIRIWIYELWICLRNNLATKFGFFKYLKQDITNCFWIYNDMEIRNSPTVRKSPWYGFCQFKVSWQKSFEHTTQNETGNQKPLTYQRHQFISSSILVQFSSVRFFIHLVLSLLSIQSISAFLPEWLCPRNIGSDWLVGWLTGWLDGWINGWVRLGGFYCQFFANQY